MPNKIGERQRRKYSRFLWFLSIALRLCEVLSSRIWAVCLICPAGKGKSLRLLRFERYTHICPRDAREWREICCLAGFWKVVERYTIIKNEVKSKKYRIWICISIHAFTLSYLTTFKRLSLEFHSFTDSHINVSW